MININEDTNLHYYVTVSHETDCSECDPNDYHRNCRIIGAEVESIRPRESFSLVEEFTDKNDEIESILSFILFRHGFDKDCFDIEICGGYYGEEIESVKLNEKGLQLINDFNRFNIIERVFMVMQLHYRYILPPLLKCENWEIERVNPKYVIAPEQGLSKVDEDLYTVYMNEYPKWFPGCLAIKTKDNKYRIIDGFHRYLKYTKDKNRKFITLLVGS